MGEMKRLAKYILLPVAVLILSQCSGSEEEFSVDTVKALAHPQAVILYSLNPIKAQDTAQTFHGYVVLDQIRLNEKQTKAAVAAVNAAVPKDHALLAGDAPSCFRPRHGLKVAGAGHIYDFVICYECGWLEEYVDGNLTKALTIQGTPKALNELLALSNPF